MKHTFIGLHSPHLSSLTHFMNISPKKKREREREEKHQHIWLLVVWWICRFIVLSCCHFGLWAQVRGRDVLPASSHRFESFRSPGAWGRKVSSLEETFTRLLPLLLHRLSSGSDSGRSVVLGSATVEFSLALCYVKKGESFDICIHVDWLTRQWQPRVRPHWRLVRQRRPILQRLHCWCHVTVSKIHSLFLCCCKKSQGVLA